MSLFTGGEVVDGLVVDGRPIHAAVVDENVARAAAGITLALGTVAFVYAYFDAVYWPLQVVSTLFLVEFGTRVTFGLRRSPVGMAAGWLMRRRAPDWVSAKPKRFAWSIGVSIALSMTIITNVGIRGLLPRTLCAICLVFMWLETSLGLCLGCEIHGFLVRRGWARKDEAFEICADGACAVPTPRLPA